MTARPERLRERLEEPLLADYVDGCHEGIDGLLGAHDRASEMISEVDVPRSTFRATGCPNSWPPSPATSARTTSTSSTGR